MPSIMSKNLNVITPPIRNLLDKLRIARKVYTEASSRIHNQLVKDQLKFLAERKLMCYETITSELNQQNLSRRFRKEDRISLELDKVLIELNHLLLSKNEKEVLGFCARRERELVTTYKELLLSRSFYPFVEAIITSQLEETSVLLQELERIKDAFSIASRNPN